MIHAPLRSFRLAFGTACVVAALVGLRALLFELGVEGMEPTALVSSIIGGGVFVLGLVIAGTLSDYKDAERAPTDLAAGLYAILREAEAMHEVVRTMWREQRPGYLEIHRDMVERRIRVPREIIEWDGSLHFPRSDERKTVEAVRDTAERFNAARRPFTLVGIETYRYKMHREVKRVIGDDANRLKEYEKFPGRVYALAFDPTGRYFAAGSSLDGTGEARVYEVDSSKRVSKFEAVKTPVYAVAFRPELSGPTNA